MELTTPQPPAAVANPKNNRWHVVIVGGGVWRPPCRAGAPDQRRVDVTLIDRRRNYHWSQPLLYQVATGSLSPGEISAPLRGVFSRQKNTRVLLGEVVDLDAAGRSASCSPVVKASRHDSLIVAAGSQAFLLRARCVARSGLRG